MDQGHLKLSEITTGSPLDYMGLFVSALGSVDCWLMHSYVAIHVLGQSWDVVDHVYPKKLGEMSYRVMLGKQVVMDDNEPRDPTINHIIAASVRYSAARMQRHAELMLHADYVL